MRLSKPCAGDAPRLQRLASGRYRCDYCVESREEEEDEEEGSDSGSEGDANVGGVDATATHLAWKNEAPAVDAAFTHMLTAAAAAGLKSGGPTIETLCFASYDATAVLQASPNCCFKCSRKVCGAARRVVAHCLHLLLEHAERWPRLRSIQICAVVGRPGHDKYCSCCRRQLFKKARMPLLLRAEDLEGLLPDVARFFSPSGRARFPLLSRIVLPEIAVRGPDEADRIRAFFAAAAFNARGAPALRAAAFSTPPADLLDVRNWTQEPDDKVQAILLHYPDGFMYPEDAAGANPRDPARSRRQLEDAHRLGASADLFSKWGCADGAFSCGAADVDLADVAGDRCVSSSSSEDGGDASSAGSGGFDAAVREINRASAAALYLMISASTF